MKKIMILTLMILMCGMVSAFTFDLQETEIQEGGTFVAEITSTTIIEWGDPYTIYWYLGNGTLAETDTGNMPGFGGGTIFETWATQIGQNTTNGNVSFDLNNNGVIDASVFFNITSKPSGIFTLTINDALFSPIARVGDPFAVDFKVTSDGNKVDGARCAIFGTDTNDAPIQECTKGNAYVETINGRAICSDILDNLFEDNNQYLAKIRCNCKEDYKCFDSTGNNITKANGEITFVFEVTGWLESVETSVDMTSYEGRQVASVCANINNTQTEREALEIYYQVRCGTPDDNDYRIVISANKRVEPDKRGISGNLTQKQCQALIIPEKRWMMGRNNSCYASSEVWVLNDNNEKIKGYFTTSDNFNIIINDLGVNSDWTITGDNNQILSTIVNMSSPKYDDYRAEGNLGNIDLRLDMNTPEYVGAYTDSTRDGVIDSEQFLFVQKIRSYEIETCDGSPVVSNLEVTNEGFVELEATNVNQSDVCLVGTITMRAFDNDLLDLLDSLIDVIKEWLGWTTIK